MAEVNIAPWGVVVLGKWNKAILTVKWIAKEMFQVPDETPVGVQVAFDTYGPNKVSDKGITVSVEDERLFIESERNSYEALAFAMSAARKALEALPHTPVSAVGITVAFSLAELIKDEPTGTNRKWDEALINRNFEILRHSAARSLKWEDGRILVGTDRLNDGNGSILINFELRSKNSKDLAECMGKPINEFKAHIDNLIDCLREGGIS